MVDSLTHLKILGGYKSRLYQLLANHSGDDELLVWVKEIVTYFEGSVYDDEVGNTEVITEMNNFIVKFKTYSDKNELSNSYRELVDMAEQIIDKAITAHSSSV